MRASILDKYDKNAALAKVAAFGSKGKTVLKIS